MIKINLPNNNIKEFNEPVTLQAIARAISPSMAKKVIVGKCDGVLKPLHYVVTSDAHVELFTTADGLCPKLVEYTTGLLFATALKKLFPSMVIANIEATFNSFYIDFIGDNTLKQTDWMLITKEVAKLIKQNTLKFDNQAYESAAHDKVNKFLPTFDEPLVNINTGPGLAVPSHFVAVPIKFVRAFVISSVAGAYWKNDENNAMLQRLHGIGAYDLALFKQIKLDAENAQKYDHRKLGKELEIFTFAPLIGQGLPIWLPNGTIIFQEIANFIRSKEWEYDFQEVITPVLGSEELYRISGHLEHYKEDMFPVIKVPNERMILRPMACPHHIAIFNSHPRSYRDLPYRLSEHALMHRYEASGGLSGLERVRAMTLTDAHIFVCRNQLKDEFKRCFRLINEVLAVFKIKINYLSLSVRDPHDKEKYYDDDAMWDYAESVLQESLNELRVEYQIKVGEAAFYGPKMDVQIRNVLGREITISTLQLDFLMPQKFDISFINSNNEKEVPIIIHRGLIGTFERFISILLEQYHGELPLWLAPQQIVIIPVHNEYHYDYCVTLCSQLKQHNIRVKVDNRDERLSYKIREAQMKKIPLQITIGEEEIKNSQVAVRKYGESEIIHYSLSELIKHINKQIAEKT